MQDVIDHRPPRRPDGAAQQPRVKRDPAPSRLKYRLERMWLTPLYRRIVRIGVPVFLIVTTAGIWLSDEDRRTALTDSVIGLIDKVQSREEFQVRMMSVEGASRSSKRRCAPCCRWICRPPALTSTCRRCACR